MEDGVTIQWQSLKERKGSLGKLDKVPVIEQRKIAKTDPVYITDQEFHEIMGLGILDAF